MFLISLEASRGGMYLICGRQTPASQFPTSSTTEALLDVNHDVSAPTDVNLSDSNVGTKSPSPLKTYQ